MDKTEKFKFIINEQKNNKSLDDIANSLNMSKPAISSFMRRLGYKTHKGRFILKDESTKPTIEKKINNNTNSEQTSKQLNIDSTLTEIMNQEASSSQFKDEEAALLQRILSERDTNVINSNIKINLKETFENKIIKPVNENMCKENSHTVSQSDYNDNNEINKADKIIEQGTLLIDESTLNPTNKITQNENIESDIDEIQYDLNIISQEEDIEHVQEDKDESNRSKKKKLKGPKHEIINCDADDYRLPIKVKMIEDTNIIDPLKSVPISQEHIQILNLIYDWFLDVKDCKGLNAKVTKKTKEVQLDSDIVTTNLKSSSIKIDADIWDDFERLCSNSIHSKPELISQAIKNFVLLYKNLI